MSNRKQMWRPCWVPASEYGGKIARSFKWKFQLDEVTEVYQFSRSLTSEQFTERRPKWFFRSLNLLPIVVAKGLRNGKEILCIEANDGILELLSFCPLLQLQILYEPANSMFSGDKFCDQKFQVEQWYMFNLMAREQIGYQIAFQHAKDLEDRVLKHVRDWVQSFNAEFKGLPLLKVIRTEPEPLEERFETWVRTRLRSVINPFGHTVKPQRKQIRVLVEDEVQTLFGSYNVALLVMNAPTAHVVDRRWAEAQKVIGNEVQYMDAMLLHVQTLRKLPLRGQLALNNAHFQELIQSQLFTDYDNRFLKSLLVYYPYDDSFRNVTISYSLREYTLNNVLRQVVWLVEQMQMNHRRKKQVSHYIHCEYCPLRLSCQWLGQYVETSKVGDLDGIVSKKLVPRESAEAD